MDLGLKGKKALVTAAGRGLGMSIARCLAREGVKVLVTSRTESDLKRLIEEVGGIDAGHHYFTLDLEAEDGPRRLVEFTLKEFGAPDILVHNLGGNLDLTDPFCKIEDWRKVMRLNLEIPIELNRDLVPLMQKSKWGRVCHVSSISALENQGPPAYCAAKAGLTAYARSFGRYVSPDGVIVTSILPGAVFTEGGYWDKASRERPEHVKKYLNERMAIQRFGRLEEIGEVVTFLCSEQASFCVGSAFLVDGGQGRVFFQQE